MTGYVRNVVLDRGYGFIVADNGTDWFFHRSKLEDLEWNEDLASRRVEFSEGTDRSGRTTAVNVRPES